MSRTSGPGLVVYAGVDYEAILREAEKEGEVIIWDGGNNDLPFIQPGLEITVVDPLRPGHELLYYPGEVNLRRAHAVIINKANGADTTAIKTVIENIRGVNRNAVIIKTASVVKTDSPIKGKRAVVDRGRPDPHARRDELRRRYHRR